MPTKAKAERAAVRAEFGDNCLICHDGPLRYKAMHVLEDHPAFNRPVPVCTSCRDMLSGEDTKKAARVAAKKALKRFVALAEFLDQLDPVRRGGRGSSAIVLPDQLQWAYVPPRRDA